MNSAAIVITALGRDSLNEYLASVSSQPKELLLNGLETICARDRVLYIPDYQLDATRTPESIAGFISKHNPDTLFVLVVGPIVVQSSTNCEQAANWLLLGRESVVPVISILRPINLYLVETDGNKNGNKKKPFALTLFDEACVDTKQSTTGKLVLTVADSKSFDKETSSNLELPEYLRIRASQEFVTALDNVLHQDIPPQPQPRGIICCTEFTDNHNRLRTGDPNHPAVAVFGHPSDDRAKTSIFFVRGLLGEATPFNKEHVPEGVQSGGKVSLHGLFQYVRSKLREGDEGTGNRVMMCDSSPMSPDNKVWDYALS